MIAILLIAIQTSFASVSHASGTVYSYKWGTGADVTKNSLIKKNIPKSNITNKVLKAAKTGTPIVKFGNGNGPRTLIVAGVHGSELSSQVSAMKLINYLNKKKVIKGTIYVIPFIAPKATSANIRFYNGNNLNKIANKKGSITNKVVKFAKSKNIQAVGDFHCTMPGGLPGKNIILGTKNPTLKSAKMAIAISKLTKHPYKNEYQAGKSYPGALEDVLNLKKIPSVTCEVKTPHGKIAKGSITSSYKQMIAFLKYNKNI
ncbi:succinylglutamate desuccinylase / aspartoacylase family protein [Methanobrevibacter cuticularis]|uniref:Succinylglutamate desuccinylase / aspartoacylase family protein n=1 Tax=Methanobrevibacter cuticularis TaxID=47311 RepID=A0A166CY37_9EURY|nr:succinylglutamate desuccinylase/aspartoacylase family protein [Methanobrevibacter cuticularis]KZX14984.1 succinylglutamate desuccinylase / aspartoacylase family protein [Methanobrevibacter cuticularis]